jgi:NADH-ubiquinone oxidoreductase chain 4L
MFTFFCGLYSFLINFKFLLINLLRLEYIVLGLFVFLYRFLIFFNIDIFFCLIFITFRVCEGVLGLTLLINIIRNYGVNYYQVFNLFNKNLI